MRGPDRPHFYQEVEDAHAVAVAPLVEEQTVERASAETPPHPIDPSEEIEARLASFEVEQWHKVEAGHITGSEFMRRVRQFDNELVIEIERDDVRPQPSPSPEAGQQEGRSADAGTSSKSDPEPYPSSDNRELTDDLAARMERLLNSGGHDDIELEERLDIAMDFGRTM